VSRTSRIALASQLPEPGRFWVRYAPKGWPGPPDRPWLDLAAGRLRLGAAHGARALAQDSRGARDPHGAQDPRAAQDPHGAPHSPDVRAGEHGAQSPHGVQAPDGAQAPDSPQVPNAGQAAQRPVLDPAWRQAPPLDDVLYLPPVPRHLAAWRDRLAAEQLGAGTPLLVQLLPGDDLGLPVTSGGAVAFALDLAAALLAGDLDRLSAAPGWALAVWPLLPGLTDDPALWEKGCRRLAAAGVKRVQALSPSLSPADRRRLAAGAPARVFEALFHVASAGWEMERDFARLAHRHGLEPFLPRPSRRQESAPRAGGPGEAPGREAGNRAAAAALGLAAELWLRLGRPVEPAQALYRAARWVDGTSYDVEALAREGNLGVVTVLDEASRRLILELAAGGEPALVRELLAEYLAPPDGDTGARRSREREQAAAVER
jgi:hypothetical protein